MNFNRTTKKGSLVAISSLSLVAFAAFQLWLVWPSLVVESIQWQRKVNTQLADLLYMAQSTPLVSGSYLVGFSFLYGMLHSLGPGHGKVIVSTYLATHPTKVRASLVLTVVSALCQALVAILLVTILLWGFNASMRMVNDKASTFVSLSFMLVLVLGTLICWKAGKKIYHLISTRKLKVKVLRPIYAQSSMAPISLQSNKLSLSPQVHQHDTNTPCGCGHQHVAEADAINRASTLREYVGIVITVGIRPCTGAIMALLFANMVGTYWMGVMSAVAMAGGTALTTSIIAILTLTSKNMVKRYMSKGNTDQTKSWQLAGYYLQFFGGLLLMSIGLLLSSSQEYGISPVL
jgi:nickel/cobalt exporter